MKRFISFPLRSAGHIAREGAEELAYHLEARTAALRALAQSGGTLGVVDAVLSAKSPGELVAQWQLGEQVLAVLSHRSAAVATISTRTRKRSVQAGRQVEERRRGRAVRGPEVQRCIGAKRPPALGARE